MARDRLPAGEIVDELIAVTVAPTLKAAGFSRIGRDFHRRLGEAVQVVNVLENVHGVRGNGSAASTSGSRSTRCAAWRVCLCWSGP